MQSVWKIKHRGKAHHPLNTAAQICSNRPLGLEVDFNGLSTATSEYSDSSTASRRIKENDHADVAKVLIL